MAKKTEKATGPAPRIRITSDGTAKGTTIVDTETGAHLENITQSVVIRHAHHDYPVAEVVFCPGSVQFEVAALRETHEIPMLDEQQATVEGPRRIRFSKHAKPGGTLAINDRLALADHVLNADARGFELVVISGGDEG